MSNVYLINVKKNNSILNMILFRDMTHFIHGAG